MYLHFMDKVAWISWENKVFHLNIFATQQISHGIVALSDKYQNVKRESLIIAASFIVDDI